MGSYRYVVLLAHLREFFPGQYLLGGADEDGFDGKAPRLRGGGLRAAKTWAKEPPTLATPSRAPRTGYKPWLPR